jgi:NAD(P)-dependent dehydrogenase (short-subunit alcohol dehydrogenase family)
MNSNLLNELFGLSGQTAVVIGGTGTLGGALCEGLAAAGARVIVAGREEDAGRRRVDAITASGCHAAFVPVDVTSRESLARLRDETVEATGRVEMLVNCAGVNAATPYFEIGDDEWDHVFAVNTRATQIACQLFGEHMAAAGGGAILNIGSVSAGVPLSKVFAYSASKAAVVNLTKNLARELAPRNVRVNVLCPGFFPADQNRKILTPERTAAILSRTPLGRFGEPGELVGAALLLLSARAGSFITGSELYIDGGFTATSI